MMLNILALMQYISNTFIYTHTLLQPYTLFGNLTFSFEFAPQL